MDFYEMREQGIALLQQHGRATSRALTCQLDLDEEALEDLPRCSAHTRKGEPR